jgi:ketosteroid isomerase-like protein
MTMSQHDDYQLPPGQADRWIGAYAQAWRDKDADAAAALFTPDGTYQSHPTAAPHQGTAAIRAYWMHATATQRELDLRFGQPLVTVNRACVEWWAVMRDSDWGPGRADDSVTLPGCLILRFVDGGLCAALREYWNADFGRALAAPPSWGT